jgi:soluble lytic murein transglycosylase
MLASIEQQRAIFHDASFALNTNQISKYNRLLKKLDGYPVKAYLEYEALKRRIHQASKNEVARFLKNHQDYPFNYHLRAKWLSVLARRQDWSSYLMFFDDRKDTRFQCLAFQARLSLGVDETINEEIKNIWLSGYSQPRECDKAFSYLLDTYAYAEQLIWLRIDKAFKARRPNLARYLGKKLNLEDQAVVDTWYQAHRRPEKSLKTLAQSSDNEQNRTIIVHAIDRLARKDSLSAKHIWTELEPKFKFSEDQRDQLRQRIALSSAYQHGSHESIFEIRTGKV